MGGPLGGLLGGLLGGPLGGLLGGPLGGPLGGLLGGRIPLDYQVGFYKLVGVGRVCGESADSSSFSMVSSVRVRLAYKLDYQLVYMAWLSGHL